MKSKLKNQRGFTIIEVLIVLAIAGLILLIIFLAVPALQRNSRNTQRKNDVAALLGGINDFVTNNNGRTPLTITYSNGTVTFNSTAPGTVTSQANVGYFQDGVGTGQGQIELVNTYVARGPFITAANDRVALVVGAGCSTATAGLTTGGSNRSYAGVSLIENGNNSYAGTCVAS